MPAPAGQGPLHITTPCGGKNGGKHAKSTATCLSKHDGFEVIADVLGRWCIYIYIGGRPVADRAALAVDHSVIRRRPRGRLIPYG